jgi:MFS family permease
VQVGLGFGVILLAIDWFESRTLAMFLQLFLVYFLHTTAELCISPVGLSMVTKLAPAHITGLVMGAWFLSIACGNNLAGILSSQAMARWRRVRSRVPKRSRPTRRPTGWSPGRDRSRWGLPPPEQTARPPDARHQVSP